MNVNFVWKWYGMALVAVVLLSALVFLFLPELYSENWIPEFTFVAFIYALSFFVFLRSMKAKPESRALIFMALTTGKMLLAMIFALVLIMGFEIDALSDILYFVSLYLIFLVVEVMVFTKAISGENLEKSEKMS
jgi:hypothetical protein